jgi:hypothetical protein
MQKQTSEQILDWLATAGLISIDLYFGAIVVLKIFNTVMS